MLKIHKSHSKKLLLIPITSICITFGLLGFYYLTYTPKLSHAETVTYEPLKETRTMANITYMQDITPEICQNSELNKQYTLTDKRDNNTYTVARIKNSTNNESNCWMTQNLRLVGEKSINLSDSDVSESYDLPASVVLSKDDNPKQFFSNDQYQSKLYYANDLVYGAYYNWYTATAGTGDKSIEMEGANATSSICPKHWKLPYGGSEKSEYGMLLGGITMAEVVLDPYRFLYGGYVLGSELDGVDKTMRYWTSTFGTSDGAYAAGFGIGLSWGISSSPYAGFSVRCVTRSKSAPNSNVEVAVNPMISLNVVDEVVVKKVEANPSTANLNLKVASNQPYSINLNAKDHAELTSNTTEVKIPSASGALDSNTNAWGIKKPEEAEYTAVTTTPQLFYQSTAAEIKTILFTIGISTAPDIPNGEYSTDITITATQN